MRRPSSRLLAAGVLAGLALPGSLAGLAASPAAAAGTDTSQAGPANVVITSVTPAWARPGEKVTVSGLLTNTSQNPLSALTVQLRSSSTPFAVRDQLQLYADGQEPTADVPERGALTTLTAPVPPGGTVSWSAVLPVNEVHMSSFGVYPLAAQATSAAGVLATSRTFLPFWPTAKAAVRPQRDPIAWIWPLINSPEAGPCPGLLNDKLATSLSPGGRLSGLLGAGTSPDGLAARLTYAIDPALLSSATEMRAPYQVGASRSCRHGTIKPASAAAGRWLAQLRTAVTRQPAFATPYADVDTAALTRQDLDSDARWAFAEGRSEAASVLHRNFAPASQPAGRQNTAGLLRATAWPADGQANYTMVQDLAAVNGIQAVILSTSAMPPVQQPAYTPSAIASTNDGEGGNMRVLLADATLTRVLSSASATSPRGAGFAASQRMLAETAMIAAEAPQLARAIVVAPPRHWNPPPGLAHALLADTDSAPWLTPTSAGSLMTTRKPAGQVTRHAPGSAGRHQLSRALLRRVKTAEHGVRLVESIRVSPDPQLRQAIAGIESSAWRGAKGTRKPAWSLLRRVQAYVGRQESGISIIGPGRDTLGGQKGAIPVSVDNRLGYPVRVKVVLSVSQAPGGGFAVLNPPGVVTVPANSIYTKKIRVRAADIGSTTIGLRLYSPDGTPLTSPGVTVTVQATHFGTFALIILVAALGVFMITSATRAARRGRATAETPDGDDAPAAGTAGPESAAGPEGAQPASDGGDTPDGGYFGAAQDPHGDANWPAGMTGSGAGGHEQHGEPDTVGRDRTETGAARANHASTEDADDYARVPGWADRR
ncbi:MAG TPA: DUF6049 family protein [Streptosporangiaceae bacterium]